MIKPKTVLIPISEIRIVNPRSRNQVTFNLIKASIASVGLKKPITVHQRALEDDGTRYDLICGQGRLESVRDLGDEMIDAIINNAPEDDRYIMSLVENLARRSPCTTDLLREVKRLNGQHYKPATIAEKLGMDCSYISGIINLLRHGEDDLIKRVEAGGLPIDTAIKLATGGPTSNEHSPKRTRTELSEALSCVLCNNLFSGAREPNPCRQPNAL